MNRKNISKLLIVGIFMLISCGLLFAQKETKTLNIAIWSDVHLMAPALLDGPGGNAASRFDKMLYETDALCDAAFELLKQRPVPPDILLLPGDLTSNGEKASHELLAQKLAQVKAYFPNIKIYVIDGNHDINMNGNAQTFVNGYGEPTPWVTDAEFQSIYATFGYGDINNEYYVPASGDYGANSYVAHPAEGVTLIAIDVDNHSDGNFPEELVQWVIQKAQEAQDRGDAILAMMHHGLVPHLTVEPKYWGSYLVPNYESISHRLADAGIHWMFTGHMHANDIASVTSPSGNMLYDIETGSLVTYPSPVRYLTYTIEEGEYMTRTETLTSEVELITSINYTDPGTGMPVTDLEAYYLPNYMSEEQVIGVVMGNSVNSLVDQLMTALDTVVYVTPGGATHIRSRALLESLLEDDLANYVPTLFSSVLPLDEASGMQVDVAGVATITIWRDEPNHRINIKGLGAVVAITDAKIASNLITPAFNKIDADYLLNSAYMHTLANNIIREIGNYQLPTDDGNHRLMEAAFLAYIGHLAGEENPTAWAIEILDGLKDGSVTDILLDHALSVVMAELNNTILPSITLDGNSLVDVVTGGTFGIPGGILKAGVASQLTNLGSLLSLMGVSISDIAGDALNSSIVPVEYKEQISGLIVEIMESLMVDVNYPEDNFTTMTHITDFCAGVYSAINFEEVYDNDNNVTGDFRIAVWSDVHVLPQILIGANSQSPEFLQAVAGDRKMFAESAAILDAAIAQIKIDAPDVLIIPGDLTKDGEVISHQYLAAKLNDVKTALPDIKIYVINGNHDVNNHSATDYSTTPPSATPTVTAAEFMQIYNGFGYGDTNNIYYTPPTGKQAGGLSYVSHPKEGVTFIAIDAGKYSADATKSGADEHETAGNITLHLRNWVVRQLNAAKERGDFIFGMVHQGVIPHFSLEPVYLADYLTDNYEEDARVLADAGLRYVFTGHMHANDIATITTPSGNTIYDIETGALVTYPSPTRLLGLTRDTVARGNRKFVTESISVITRMIKEIDFEDPATGDKITDLTQYGRDHSLSPYLVVGLLQGAVLNDLIDNLVETITTTEITTFSGNTHTGSRALIESLLADTNNDFGDLAVGLMSTQLVDTMEMDLSTYIPSYSIRIYYDTLQSQVVINLQTPSEGEVFAYITEANLKAYMIDPAFVQLDTAYVQKKSFTTGLLNRILLTALTANLRDAIPCNDHTLIDAALRAYLGHLGGEELQPQWVTDIVDGLDIVQHNGESLNYILDKTLASVMETELPDILNGITVNLNELVTGDPTIIALLPIYFGSETPSINTLFTLFNMDLDSLTGSLNSSVIPDEYKAQIGELFLSAINSFLVDDNYTEDNITHFSHQDIIPLPTVTIDVPATGGLCAGESIDLHFTGAFPYTLEYTVNGMNPDVAGLPSPLVVYGNDTTIIAGSTGNFEFEFVSLIDNNEGVGSSNVFDFTITVNPLPTATIAENQSLCLGDSVELITLTGNQPWAITYNDGISNLTVSGITSSPYWFKPIAAGTYQFTLVSVSDANCSNTATGNTSITVNPLPTANIIAVDQTICLNDSVNLIYFTGTAPYGFTYNDGLTNHTEMNIGSSFYSFKPIASGNYSFNLISVNDDVCGNTTTGNVSINVNSLPTANIISTTESICLTDSVELISLTGVAPWTIKYNDGNAVQTLSDITSPYWFKPTAAGTYQFTLISVSDINCSNTATGTTSITVNPLPTANIIAVDQTICLNDSVNLIYFTGTAPYGFTYNDGLTNHTEINIGSSF
ncbi:MAG: metallophosphoesterase, partial [Bacteroidales bacterium]|nr:metallophosphoesterase [Bacteroidales bacterium]